MSVTVTVYELVCDEPDIFVPNTFTPNGDGMNDLLLVRGRHITDMEFEVFDRWGEKVFETRDQGFATARVTRDRMDGVGPFGWQQPGPQQSAAARTGVKLSAIWPYRSRTTSWISG